MGKQDMNSLENDIAATRERLAGTIDELVYRANPKTIAQRQTSAFKGFFIDVDGSPRAENIAKVAIGIGGFVAVVVVLRKITS